MGKLTIDERIKKLTAQKERAEAIAKAKADRDAASKKLKELRKRDPFIYK